MSTDNDVDDPGPLDPKEQMRAALAAKKAARHGTAAAGPRGGAKASGGPHGQQGGRRQFRRKAGG